MEDNTSLSLSRNTDEVKFFVSKTLRAVFISLNHANNDMDRNMEIANAHSLETMVFKDCGFKHFTGELFGVEHVKHLDFSFNDLSTLTPKFLRNFGALESLFLIHSNLDADFTSQQSDRVFCPMRQLKELNLGSNSLIEFSAGTFQNNRQLESLCLRDNKFRGIPFDISLTPRLRHLDMTKNAIVTLNAKERQELDAHSNKLSSEFHLMLDENIMSCSCNDISFLIWLSHTTIPLDNQGNYSCNTPQGQSAHTSLYRDTRAMWRLCTGSFHLWFSLILLALMAICFLAVILASRHANYIRAAILRMVDKSFKAKTREDYAIGVFVGYAEQDYRFPCLHLLPYLEHLGLTVYVCDRDSLPSQDAATGIMEAIQNSWRVILVITQAFLTDDHWSEFTMRSAVYSQCPDDPARVMLVVEEGQRDRLPTELVAAVADENIVLLSRLAMCYELRQKLKTFLLQT